MVSSPKTPTPPDPQEQARAQSGANREAAIAGSLINNVNEVSPYGSVDYTRTGDQTYTDADGNEVSVPQTTRTTTLDPAQQRLLDLQNQTGENLGTLGRDQSAKLNDMLNTPFDLNSLSARPDTPTLDRSGGPGSIQSSVNLQNDQNELGYTGPAVTDTNLQDIGSVSEDRRRVEDAFTTRANEDIDRQQAGLETRLLNQGITPGSEAWNTRMDEINRRRTDTTTQGILAGGQEQSRQMGLDINRGMFNLGRQGQAFGQAGAERGFEREGINTANMNALASGGFANSAEAQRFAEESAAIEQRNNAALAEFRSGNALRDSELSESFAARNQPINEITALTSGGQVTNPTFTGPYQQSIAAAQPAKYASDNYAQQVAAANASRGGMFGLGAAGIKAFGPGAAKWAFSDVAVKRNIEYRGKTSDGFNVYDFNYTWGGPRQTGVMAHEVEQIIPSAVSTIAGIKCVDYSQVI